MVPEEGDVTDFFIGMTVFPERGLVFLPLREV